MSAFKLLLAAPLLLSAVPNQSTVNNGLPPERFRGNSVSFVVFTSRAGINVACGVARPGFIIIACKRQIDGVPVIFMPNPCPMGERETYARIMCHENAHTLGWSG